MKSNDCGLRGGWTDQAYVCGRAPGPRWVFLSLAPWAGRCSWKARRAPARPRSPKRRSAAALGRRLIRLQCYEGLDAQGPGRPMKRNFPPPRWVADSAPPEAQGSADKDLLQNSLFRGDFPESNGRLMPKAMRPDPAGAPVLLIDEIDRNRRTLRGPSLLEAAVGFSR